MGHSDEHNDVLVSVASHEARLGKLEHAMRATREAEDELLADLDIMKRQMHKVFVRLDRLERRIGLEPLPAEDRPKPTILMTE